ncbi:reverse transcriptase [Gossypium australe]|uniref:Reverse transcriptase n=1 Tax=Gossypium australe TaxID=47621 RepID=A0A5B6WFH9_9ROSI|nr:reverse transcriptase [Gossypium australe]
MGFVFKRKGRQWWAVIQHSKGPFLTCFMKELLVDILEPKQLGIYWLVLCTGKGYLKMFEDGLENMKSAKVSRGKSTILVVVDQLTKYDHFMALHHPFTAASVAYEYLQHIYKLHGAPETFVSNRDEVFLSHFWQELFKHVGTQLHLSVTYHLQTYGQTKALNKYLESYLRCMSREKPSEWVVWLFLAEWWYSTTYHSAIYMTPYDALYGQEPSVHLPYLAGVSRVAEVDRSLQHREAVKSVLRFYLKRSQERMKQIAGRKRSNREFEVGDRVYVKLQPYIQHSLKQFRNQKLAPRYFGPFPVEARVGKVAYKLTLHVTAKIHHTFHVSQLKKHVGSAIASVFLLVTNVDGSMIKEPIRILDKRMVKRGNSTIIEVLAEWADMFSKDATWENWSDMHQRYSHFNH